MAESRAGVQQHYGSAGLVDRILKLVAESGEDVDRFSPATLYPLDQFHGRRLAATEEQTAKLALKPGARVLDVGCGIGGPARYMAAKYGCKVAGIDLTEEFVIAARDLTARCGLADKIEFHHGNALLLPFADSSFDAAACFNITMNIQDKAGVLREIARVLRPGAKLAYTETGIGPSGAPPLYPLPWAQEPSVSFLVTPAELRAMIEGAKLRVIEWSDETQAILAFAQKMRDQPPASPLARVGTAIWQGDNFAERARNSSRNQQEGRLVSSFVLAERAQ